MINPLNPMLEVTGHDKPCMAFVPLLTSSPLTKIGSMFAGGKDLCSDTQIRVISSIEPGM